MWQRQENSHKVCQDDLESQEVNERADGRKGISLIVDGSRPYNGIIPDWCDEQMNNTKSRESTSGNGAGKIPFFSIITVCRNEEDTIEATMDSILQQTDHDLEYIFIDGKSEDRTCAVIQGKMEGSGVPYRLISERDAGVYDAMNKGARLSRGAYLYYINCKDMLCGKEVIAKVHKALIQERSADIIYGNVIFCYADRNIRGDYVSHKRLSYRRIALEQYVCHQAVFARRQLYLDHPLDTTFRVIGDNEWMAYWSRHQARIDTIDEFICDFDMTGGSQRHTGSPQALWEADEIARRYCKPVYYLTKPLKAVVRALRH